MSGRFTIFAISALAAACTAGAAQAQTAPISRIVPVSFTGVVADNAGESIQIRQPDGSLAPYTGPLPVFPYAQGDAVSISFNATMPTRAFYDTVYQGQLATDGIYRIKVTSGTQGTIGNVGNATLADISGPLGFSPNYGEGGFDSMTIVYNYNTDSYSLEGAGNFFATPVWGASYTYDSQTGTISACTTFSCALPSYDYGSYALRADAAGSTISAANVRIFDSASFTNPSLPPIAGTFGLSFTGGWNLPQFGGGNPNPVPEPGMLLLFGVASALVPLRRRMKRAA